MTYKSINIKHITCVVNLKNTTASDYLKFEYELNKILYSEQGTAITFEVIANEYLVVYIFPSAADITISNKLKKALSVVNLDYVIIDELFPHDNSHFLKENGNPTSSSWITSSNFSNNESIIEVE
jgi:hypothetical protein